MPKREASEYITKEDGSTPNDTSDTKAMPATAAQMAKRRMAAPKSRMNKTTLGAPTAASNPFSSTTFGASSASNPFSSSTFSAPQSQTFGSVGDITFGGESKSFPPSSTSATNGNTFSFTPSNASSSFTFGQTVQNNPFSSLNSHTAQENKGTDDTMMESPQKKQPIFAGFGSDQSAGTSVSSGTLFGGFGQSTQAPDQPKSQPIFTFGQPQVNGFSSGASTSTFGQSVAPEAPKEQEAVAHKSSLFDKPPTSTSTATNGLFGQPAPSPSFDFGQSTTEVPKSPFSFGQPQPSQATPQKTPTFSFGQPPSQTKPTTSTFSFGQSSSQPPTSTAAFTPSSLLGTSQFSAAGDSLGNSTSASPVPATPAFTAATALQSAESAVPAAETTSSSEDAATRTPVFQKSSSQENPFASLFAGSTTQKPDPPKEATEVSTPLFNFGTPTQPSTLFGSSQSANSKPATESFQSATPKSSFNHKPTEQAGSSKLHLTAEPAIPATETLPAAKPSLFGNQPLSPNKAKATSTQSGLGQLTPNFSFGQATASTPPVAASNSQASSFSFGAKPSSMTSFGASSTPSAQSPAPVALPGSDLASQPQVVKNQSTSERPFNPDTPDTHPKVAPPAFTSKSSTAEPSRNLYSNPPTRIPPYLNGDKYKSYDSNYRLHSLNREFQKRLATIDPTKNDFETLVRVYVAARESIGESIGLYVRNVAGTKRKEDSLDSTNDVATATKKARVETVPGNAGTPVQNHTASAVFQPVSSAIKPPVSAHFGTFGSVTPTPTRTSATADTNTSSLFKKMIPESETAASPSKGQVANPFASLFAPVSQPNAAALSAKATFSFGTPAKDPAANMSSSTGTTTPVSSPPKKTGFQIPSFSAPSGMDFMKAFASQSAKNASQFEEEEKAKRKAEEFDSDEDDEEEWNRKYEEEKNAKRAKIGGVTFQGFTPASGTFDSKKDATLTDTVKHKTGGTPQKPVDLDSGDDTGSGPEDEEEVETEDDADETVAQPGDEDEEAEADEDVDEDDAEDESSDNGVRNGTGPSLFDRITRGSDDQAESTPKATNAPAAVTTPSMFGGPLSSTPEAPRFSPITPATGTSYKPATTFNFTATPKHSPTPTAGASVFAGGLTREGPLPGEGLFGSRSGTPVNGEQPRPNPFANLGTPQKASAEDHTWKKGSAIKFDTLDAAPSVEITAPSPVKATPKFDTLFGQPTSGGNTTGTAPLGFNFSTASMAPAPGFLGAVSHLAPTSGTDSGISSRATSPGGTDNESVATNETDDTSNDPQNLLLASVGPYPGEENEDILFEVRAKMCRNYKEEEVKGTRKQKGWNTEGVGPMRVLKHKDTGKTRMVGRAEPGANVILNCNLASQISYKATGNQIVFPIFSANGPPEQWLVKVKTAPIAVELATLLEANKGSA